VAEDGPDALLLDVSGCAHLFGGEEALLETISHAFDRLGLSAHIALAETRGAAWAMARYRAPQQGGPVRIAAGETRTALSPLPPAALRLGEEVTESLDRLGLKTIDALLALPRASLARRAGVLTVRRMDQALGAEPEPVCPAAPPPTYAVRQSLPEPLTTLDAVMAVLERLLRRLCQTLETRQEGLRGLRITLRRVDHSDAQTTVGLAKASRDLALILRLCETPVSALKSGFGFEQIRLQADPVEPLALYRQDSLAPADDGVAVPQQAALESLLSRLGGRLGFDNLLTLRLGDTHLPNQRNQWLPWGQSNCPPLAARPPKSAAQRRPLVLFPPEPLTPAQKGCPPAAFLWRRGSYTLASAQGPERIAPPWWDNAPAWRSGLRDYWQVQTAEGPRLWLFHLPQRAALLSGMGEQPTACWFVEGAFP
jgi:protein ImuB